MPLRTHQGIHFMLFFFLIKSARSLPWSLLDRAKKSLYLLLYHTLIFATDPDGYTIARVADGFRKKANPISTTESVLIFWSLHLHKILVWWTNHKILWRIEFSMGWAQCCFFEIIVKCLNDSKIKCSHLFCPTYFHRSIVV